MRVPDVPKIAPIIEFKEHYFHQKPRLVCRRRQMAGANSRHKKTPAIAGQGFVFAPGLIRSQPRTRLGKIG